MKIPIYYTSVNDGTKREFALVDSGATENFLDYKTARRWKVGLHTLDVPIEIYNVDGTENKRGRITEYCILYITMGTKTKKQMFFVTELGSDRLILGYPWLRGYNPELNWQKGTLGQNTPKVQIQTTGYEALLTKYKSPNLAKIARVMT
jgi:hypothetical protein